MLLGDLLHPGPYQLLWNLRDTHTIPPDEWLLHQSPDYDLRTTNGHLLSYERRLYYLRLYWKLH